MQTAAGNQQVDCSVYPAQASSPYVLPYAGGTGYAVSTTTAHTGDAHYAIDFLMPIGTPVTAGRAGTVFDVKQDAYDTDHALEDGNYVFVLHDDRTLGVYGHMTHNGALVNRGDQVSVGQQIAMSGNSGLSNAPHLHFGVVRCDVEAWTNGMKCPPANTVSVPVVFRNTTPTPCGLQVGQTYTANSL